MRYVMAKYAQYRQEMAYRVYISDSIYSYTQQKRLNIRYVDLIHPQKIEDTRSGDEIALDIISRLGLKVE